ncbi:MAG: type IV pilus modification PilV family protein [Planctomycetota bacterium]
MRRLRAGFTLIEVAVAIGLLAIGLAAVTSVYLTGLRWAEESRSLYTGTETGRQVLLEAGLLSDTPQAAISAGHSNGDTAASGWLNGYFVLREEVDREDLPASAGILQTVRIRVYAGGDDRSGRLVQDMIGSVLLPGS